MAKEKQPTHKTKRAGPSFPYPTRTIHFHMVGRQPFFLGKVRAPLVDVLFAHKELTPETISRGTWVGDPFKRKAFCAEDYTPDSTPLILRRKLAIPYSLSFLINEFPLFDLEFFPAKMKSQDLETLFLISDQLTAAYRPDIGWTHLYAEVNLPSRRPEKVIQELMNLGTSGYRGEYQDHGPGALGLRTYLGPHLVDQIGRKRLLSLPAPCEVEELGWGGVRVDLAHEPWRTEASVLCNSWQAAMDHLRPAHFFAIPTVHANGAVSWQRATKCDPGGQVR